MDEAAVEEDAQRVASAGSFTSYTVGRAHRRFRVTLYTFQALTISRHVLKGRLSLSSDRFLRWKEHVS